MQKLLSRETREALRDGSYEVAYDIARSRLEHVDLAEGLERTLLAAKEDTVVFDAMAARWIVLAVDARCLTLHHVGWAAERFQEVLEPWRNPEPALRKLLA